MYLTIIFLPLLGSIVSGFFGRKTGIKGSHLISCLSIIITTILAILAFFEVGFNNNSVSIILFKWLTSESINIVWSFQFDSLTVSMLIPVLIISSLVHIYSIGYMDSDPHNQRFFSYLNLFTFMMIILVTSNNYLLMFVGWEGVGVCSYLLVSFWFTRIAANQSSISAFLTNRVGDCFLTLGMFGLLWCLGNLDYTTIFSLSPYINNNIITIIGICLLIGAMAKSSQIGLHVWLPMAMEGPTPVSALIHAATMVTAGVYLLIRSSPLIEYSSTVLLLCLWLGAVTTLFSSVIGLFQGDIKKIIAYSTMSQLGMMVISIGLSSYNLALFHLINHAFYKGLLFLGAGAVIHAVIDNQDLRKYGGLIHWLPLTYSVILIASLSLVAFPFMTGFFSKDFILESSYGQYHLYSIVIYVIALIGAIFTTLYSVKILYLTFLTSPNGSIYYYKNAHEGNIFISLPLIILALFSIYFGFLTKDIYIGLGSGFLDNSIFIHPSHEISIDTEFSITGFLKLLPLFLTLFIISISVLISELYPFIVNNFKLSNIGYLVFGFFNQRFLIELFYNKFIVNMILLLGGQTTKTLDKGSIELIGPYGIQKIALIISKIINNLNNGIVTNYGLYIVIGIIIYLINIILNSFFFLIFGVVLLFMLNIWLNKKSVYSSNNLESSLSRHLANWLIIRSVTLLIIFVFTGGLTDMMLLDSEDGLDSGSNMQLDSEAKEYIENKEYLNEPGKDSSENLTSEEKKAEEKKAAWTASLGRVIGESGSEKTFASYSEGELKNVLDNKTKENIMTEEKKAESITTEERKAASCNASIKSMQDENKEIPSVQEKVESWNASVKKSMEDENEEKPSEEKKVESWNDSLPKLNTQWSYEEQMKKYDSTLDDFITKFNKMQLNNTTEKLTEDDLHLKENEELDSKTKDKKEELIEQREHFVKNVSGDNSKQLTEESHKLSSEAGPSTSKVKRPLEDTDDESMEENIKKEPRKDE